MCVCEFIGVCVCTLYAGALVGMSVHICVCVHLNIEAKDHPPVPQPLLPICLFPSCFHVLLWMYVSRRQPQRLSVASALSNSLIWHSFRHFYTGPCISTPDICYMPIVSWKHLLLMLFQSFSSACYIPSVLTVNNTTRQVFIHVCLSHHWLLRLDSHKVGHKTLHILSFLKFSSWCLFRIIVPIQASKLRQENGLKFEGCLVYVVGSGSLD